MNCLITAIGSFSADAVIASLRRHNVAKVIGCDIHPATWVPASILVDACYHVPLATEGLRYMESLIAIISKEKIDYVIPLTDPEVDILSDHRRVIEEHGATVCMPSEDAVRICRNKLRFHEFFLDDREINVIPTFEVASISPDSCAFPLIAKPTNGRSSEGIFLVDSEEDLRYHRNRLQRYVLQPLLKGEIYTVDLVRDDLHDRSVAIPRKELIRTKNGAGMSVEICPNDALVAATRHVGRKLHVHGCINMEYIYARGRFNLMDINPRFSAGVAFSILAGYDMVLNHLNCFTGDAIQDPVPLRSMTIVKRMTEIITETGE